MRSSARLAVIIGLLLLTAISAWFILTTPGLKPVVVSIYKPPMVYAEARVKNIGKVETDSHVHEQFLLYNKGGSHLRISDVETSCGCTVAGITKRVIAPGDFTQINVDLDTSIKLGPVRKELTVVSNDPKRPKLSLFLLGDVLPKKMKGHEQITLEPKDKLVLFKGECATCHVQQGKGKSGKALFLADCAMCHGSNAQGNHSAGPTLLGGNYEDEAVRQHVRDVVANGSRKSPQMPPFGAKNGGPLNGDEIDSLVNFLQFLAMQQKMGLLDKPNAAELENEAAFSDALKQPH